jgi:hypothetical protein
MTTEFWHPECHPNVFIHTSVPCKQMSTYGLSELALGLSFGAVFFPDFLTVIGAHSAGFIRAVAAFRFY